MKKSCRITVSRENADVIENQFEKSSRLDREKEEIRLFIQKEKKVMIQELEQECSAVVTRMQSAMEDYRRYFLKSLSCDIKKLLVKEFSSSVEKSSDEESIINNDKPEADISSFPSVEAVVPAEDHEPQTLNKGGAVRERRRSFSYQPALEDEVKGYLSNIDGRMIEAMLDDFMGGKIRTPEDASSQKQIKNCEEKTCSEIVEHLTQNGFVPADYQITQSEEALAQSSLESEIDELTAPHNVAGRHPD